MPNHTCHLLCQFAAMEASMHRSSSLSYLYQLLWYPVLFLPQPRSHRLLVLNCRASNRIVKSFPNLLTYQPEHEKGVHQIWDEMERSESGPDQRSFTIMVYGLHSQEKLDEALQYYTTMKSRGLIPEPRTKILVKAIHMKKDGAVTEDQSANMTGKNLKLDPRSSLFHVHK